METIGRRFHPNLESIARCLTLLERKSLYCWLMPMANRKAGITAAACVQALAAFKPHSITFDNGQKLRSTPRLPLVRVLIFTLRMHINLISVPEM